MAFRMFRSPDDAGSGGGAETPAPKVETPVVTTGGSGGSTVLASSGASDSPAAPPTFPSPDSFTWDAWNGGHEDLPEPVRGWGEKIGGYFNKRLAEETARLSDFETWFGGLKDSGDDSETASKLKELTTQILGVQTERDTFRTKHEQALKELETYRQQVHQAASKSFMQANQEVLALPGALDAFGSLIDESVDIDAGVSIAILKHGAATGDLAGVVKAAIDFKKGGAPDQYIMNLLGAPQKPKTVAPPASPTQTFSGGGSGSGKAGSARPSPKNSAELADQLSRKFAERAAAFKQSRE